MLTQAQMDHYHDKGWLHIPEIFPPAQLAAMQRDLDWMINAWADRSVGWTGAWRKKYMDAETEKKSQLVAMHDLQFYSQAWLGAVTNDRLCNAMAQLLGDCVELHHTTMHVKPPETGHPFPMHQDWAFYEHVDGRYIDVLVHLDNTQHENGEIRFLSGSHKKGALDHIRQNEDGTPCTPYLPLDEYRLDDTEPVPAKAGDVVIFNIFTIHGSHINQTPVNRRLVRLGYRHPGNRQTGGQSLGRPGIMVRGLRQRGQGQKLFSIAGPPGPAAASAEQPEPVLVK
ncbi:MAG: phytanoyl-CoA dioxygenase family protein [Phycisphaeraceae bacterium]